MQPLSWFFAQLFPSISSVSSEQYQQYQICAKNYPETHQVQGNLPRMRIWNQWWYRQNFQLLALFLRLMRKYNESCCVKTTGNSQNFLNNRNWPNSAPTLVFRRILTKDTSSLHLLRKDLTIWNDHVESTLYLERRKHPVWRVDSWKHEDSWYFAMANWSLDNFLGKKRRTEEKVSVLLKPSFFQHFLYFRAIQGHSGGTLVDPTWVLLPNDFAEHIYHIGNAHDMHSIIQGGLIPGGKKSQNGFILQSTPIPKVTATCTHAKFATWTSGSF